MAATTTNSTTTTTAASPQIFQTHNNSTANNNSEVSKQEIQAAIAKAVELRALHAALVQGNNSPAANLRLRSASPVSVQHASQLSAQDYPVFTPTYEDVQPGYQQYRSQNQNFSGVWDDYSLNGGRNDEIAIQSDYKMANTSSRKFLPSDLINLVPHTCPSDDQRSVTASSANHIPLHRASPVTDYTKSRRNSLGDFRSISSCNKCKPATLSTDHIDHASKNRKYSNLVVPMTDSHSSLHSQPKTRGGLNFSWLFPRLKKKHKNESSPNRTESEEVSQIYRDLGIMSIEALKKELMEAHERRDAALMEVSEMKSSVGELREKLEYLETYCEELKKALRQAVQAKDSQTFESFPKRVKSIDGNGENTMMPVSEEVMVEGFVQIVSEARLSVKQFCKTLVAQIEEADNTLMHNLNTLLLPYKLSLNSKYSKAVLYHLEAIINQALYQDFENCVFQKNGSPKLLDPQEDRQAQFSSFCALRNLSWNEVLRKGTKYYSEEFSKFCDQKMSSIITTLNWTRPWPEQLLQAFFVAAKCIWLLHLLAFSFYPPLVILRVEENRSFDSHYMEDVLVDRQRSQAPNRVKVMVMPGFYVQDRVLKCKVLCRYKTAA